MQLNPKRIELIAAACILLMAASYLAFLAATWVQFQNDRTTRMEKIDELLDRLPRPADGAVHEDDAAESLLSVRHPDPVQATVSAPPVRNETSPILRSVPQQAPPPATA